MSVNMASTSADPGRSPPDVATLSRAAKGAQERNDFAASIPLWTELTVRSPERWEFACELALDLRSSGQTSDAEVVFLRAVKRHGTYFWLVFHWARAAFFDGRFDVAEQRVRRLFDPTNEPRDSELQRKAYELLGEIAFSARDMQLAEASFETALSHQPDNEFCAERLALARFYRQVSERFPAPFLASSEFRAHADYAVLLINLDHNRERLLQTQNAFADSPVPIYRVPGVRGSYLPSILLADHGEGRRQPKGSLGCFWAHIAAWEAMLEMGLQVGLIIEDDSAPAIDLPCHVSALGIPDDFELCFVNQRMQRPLPRAGAEWPKQFEVNDPIDTILGWPKEPDGGTDGYFVTAEGARKLLRFFARDGFIGDIGWRLIGYGVERGEHKRFADDTITHKYLKLLDGFGPERVKAYCLYPHLIRHVPRYSVRSIENAAATTATRLD